MISHLEMGNLDTDVGKGHARNHQQMQEPNPDFLNATPVP